MASLTLSLFAHARVVATPPHRVVERLDALPRIELGLWQLPVPGSELYIGTTAANNKDTGGMPEPTPSLITRVRGRAVEWVTVLEPRRGMSRVASVRALPDGGLAVTLTDSAVVETSLTGLIRDYTVPPRSLP